MSPILYAFPIISALIGWITNYLAVKMLFHPKFPLKILGITIHGVFPKRQKQIAKKLGDLVANELFSISDLKVEVESMIATDETMDLIGKKIEKTIRNKLVQNFPMLSMFLTDEMVEKVTNLFKTELQEFLIETAQGIGSKIEEKVSIEKIVREKVEAFSTDKLEEILYSIMKKEFRFIEITGAILGFLIGCIQLSLAIIG
jgi:uncharacterized membrane protein YheB (UPF0754 family)